MGFPERLIEGYRAFLSGRLPVEQSRYRELAETGQSPEIMVIGCCDSRVSPEAIFDAHPGELFVVRNVANLVPPYTPDGAQRAVSAALEFAVQALHVKHIVVLGHARCGGIRAFAEQIEPLSPGDFIGKWMELIAPAAAILGPEDQFADRADYLSHLEQAAALRTIDNLMTFPCVRILVERRRLHLHAAFFDVATGLLSVFDPETKTFGSLAGANHTRLFAQPRF
ncbi:MAG: carbonic anhydrase [Pseudorhodoplanes sp.]|nr:Carbonic anhydrase 1 [Pseudorhodoplanes sp.]MCQ3942597.1 carbonic anhydrase [Alphaproteobacteria bacterium]MBW7948936.1 carbonic anhydrase [Pseudorhodoplanes sp.]MCL4709849.1 carbonic anhydrase [Pseudorhodoplanes sp.]MCZ7642116.1 carbonic anhydrase [Pseudorhodoplanes sp.]